MNSDLAEGLIARQSMDILQQAFGKAIDELAASVKTEAELAALSEIVPEQLDQLLSELSVSMLESVKRAAAAGGLKEHRKLHRAFAARNYRRWQHGFDALELLVAICTEAGSLLNERLRPEAAAAHDLVFDVLVRLHAKACLNAQETVCLLKNGFADGAHARWRALHELTVTAIFLSKNGADVAERYCLHEIVECYKGACQHKKYESRLQAAAPTDEQIVQLKIQYDQLLVRFGADFKKTYGWAVVPLGKKRVTFFDLEEAAGLDHMRPYYKWASQNVHAGVKAIRYSLGMSETKVDALQAGPSNSGMTDPAHSTAISLAQITVLLLCRSPNFDSIAMVKMIIALSDEVGEAFLRGGG